tara:strand:+ start:930 stop:1517 length:588 start_codon:yes stop_codon:yes gene_type:complete
MTRAFVCGNGISRQAVDLNQLRSLGKIYGCNGLYRDFEPDCLVATDKPIAETIQNSGYSAAHRFHTRKPIPGLGALPVPRKYHSNSSGPIATALAALDGCKTIYMLGFDMGPTANQKFNNVYAGTDFYKRPDAAPTYTGNWVKQLCAISQDFPQTNFIRVCGPTTADIRELKLFNNLVHIPVQMFIDRVNTGQEL